jgi:prevent-host-death family protein
MTSVGSLDVSRQWPELLDRVVRGERILITTDGEPVAMLSPAVRPETGDIRSVVGRIRQLRDERGPTLGAAVGIRDLIDEGRRE